ncbi:ABC transporter-like protein [Corchorus capsularis]|uniref:ABC transporter-like protein n=1 Tax=Corchorus capsularis TaxID=210143 RepID=A0A1R3G9T4_COCAP|nr:ABC transporter-like protein [Corchorus capsularis]
MAIELQKGVALLIQQFKALLKKNLLLSWRNKRATFFQLFTSFFFIFLIFCLEKSSTKPLKAVRDPKPLVSPPIPPCESKNFIRQPCFDFVWSGDQSNTINGIVKAIRENNPGRPIPENKVKYFRTINEVDQWVFNNVARVPGALHFVERNATVISYGLLTNSTTDNMGGQYEDPTLKFQIPLQIAAEREIARALIGDEKFSWNVALKEFPHPASEVKSSALAFAPTFFLAAAMFSFVFQMGCLVSEKELKLRQGLWANLEKDQLFCLLGPNGAGKTTAINCLTGTTPVTSGDALIYGHSVRSSVGMSNIRRIIGVCPQFDILWNALSGQEHIELFACIKGLHPASIKSVVEKSLTDVRLTEASKVRAESYSGGMKRRISVAVALIGDPKLVFLDEPTSGMDPITRRHVWDIIENAKRGRAIVLTTHSMEEADVLSDRIAIMAKGRLRCIGTSIRLKSRFGSGFIANIRFIGNNNGIDSPDSDVVATSYHHESVKQFFKSHLNIEPKEENKGFMTFVIPHDREKLLTEVFRKLQDREREFGIADTQLGLTTLEEVFLEIAKKAELEGAITERRLATLTLTSGTSLQIPVGSRFVKIPGTESMENPRGVMVEVYWEQDDSGMLCIAGHSSESPVPPNFQSMGSLANTNRNSLGRRGGPVFGILLNPDPTITTNHQS